MSATMAGGPAAKGAASRVGTVLATAGPPIVYGMRLAAGVGIALYVAFYLQLDNPGWAGTSAAIVAQLVLGASLRKGMFRLIGTVVGATTAVVLTAVFPQDRFGFFLCMALWCAACSFVSTLLRNFASYAAILSGFTLVIIASSSIPAPDDVFTLAVSRASEIAIGIVCGMGVMAVTDFGTASRRMAGELVAILAAIHDGFADELRRTRDGAARPDTRPIRRALVARVIALDPLIDQAVGERATIAARRDTLQAGINGLFLAISAWRTVSVHLETRPADVARALASRLLGALPGEASDLVAARDGDIAAAGAARATPADTGSTRLGLDRAASVLDGFGSARNAAVLAADAGPALRLTGPGLLLVPDALPALVNAGRVFVAVAAGTLLVVATAWPSGYTFLIFLTVTVLLLSPRNEQAAQAVIGFGSGTLLAAVLAAITDFALLPNREGYGSFITVVALVLVPVAALSARPRWANVFVPASMNFVPLLGPTNTITFDTIAFANSALAIVGGCVAGAVALQAIPPLSRATRTRRLLSLTLSEFRAAMRHPDRGSPDAWRQRVYGRVVALPAASDHADGGHMLAALTVGLQVMTLRAAATTPARTAALRATEAALARGDVAAVAPALAAWPADAHATTQDGLRIVAAVREIIETCRDHAAYFGARL